MPQTTQTPQVAGLFRRLAALLYDAILSVALVMFATALLLPFREMQAISGYNTLYNLYLASVLYLYFTWCWCHGGQTLGMKAWHLYVVAKDNGPITLAQATVRFLVAIPALLLVGIGLLWLLFDKKKRAWQDISSESKVIYITEK